MSIAVCRGAPIWLKALSLVAKECECERMLLKHIINHGSMVVKYESRRSKIPATRGLPNSGVARLSKTDSGSTREILWAAPHVYRFGGARRKERRDPEPSPDRQDVTCPVGRLFLRRAKRKVIVPFFLSSRGQRNPSLPLNRIPTDCHSSSINP